MTYEEAKFVLEKNMSLFDVRLYSAYEKAIEALEKQIPKKVIRKVVNRGFNLPMPTYVDVCPCCGIDTPNPRDLESWEFWCPDCGQALDWSE